MLSLGAESPADDELPQHQRQLASQARWSRTPTPTFVTMTLRNMIIWLLVWQINHNQNGTRQQRMHTIWGITKRVLPWERMLVSQHCEEWTLREPCEWGWLQTTCDWSCVWEYEQRYEIRKFKVFFEGNRTMKKTKKKKTENIQWRFGVGKDKLSE